MVVLPTTEIIEPKILTRNGWGFDGLFAIIVKTKKLTKEV